VATAFVAVSWSIFGAANLLLSARSTTASRSMDGSDSEPSGKQGGKQDGKQGGKQDGKQGGKQGGKKSVEAPAETEPSGIGQQILALPRTPLLGAWLASLGLHLGFGGAAIAAQQLRQAPLLDIYTAGVVALGVRWLLLEPALLKIMACTSRCFTRLAGRFAVRRA